MKRFFKIYPILAFLFYILVLLDLSCEPAFPEEIDVNRMVNAIWRAEGAEKATYAYGIKSVKYDTLAEARKICENSVRNNIKRWEKAGKPDDFISYMGRRFCPAEIHPLNRFWSRNVRKIYKEG